MTTLSPKQHFFTITKGWSAAKILTAMGVINNILYCVVKSSGALLNVKLKTRKPREKGKRSRKLHFNAIKVRQLINAGLLKVEIPISYMQSYLQKFWWVTPDLKATFRKPTLKKMFSILENELGLFRYVAAPWFGKNPTRQSTAYEDIDIKKMLLFYEHLEDCYMHLGHEVEDLPGHKGNFVRLLFNWFFGGLGYRRTGDPERGTAPSVPDTPWYKLAPQYITRAIATSINYQGFEPIPKTPPPVWSLDELPY